MAEFVLNRNHTVVSLTGFNIRFDKGIPTTVPPSCFAEVMAIGAERIDAAQDAGFAEDVAAKEEPQGLEREAQVFECFESLIKTNKREDFTASGAPHIKAIKAVVGYTVDNKERDLLWAKYKVVEGAKE